MDAGDLFQAVWSRKLLAIPALALTFGLVGLYLLVTPARYAAQMAILVDTRQRPPIGADVAPIPRDPDLATIESQMRLLSSSGVLRLVVDREQLRLDPEFALQKPPGVWEKIKSLLGAKSHPQTDVVDTIVEALAGSIAVKPRDKSHVLDVEVRSSGPEKAERLARALLDAYLETQSKIDDDLVDRQSEWLDRKLKDLRDRLQDAEQRIEEFRKSQSLLATDDHLSPEDQMKAANAAREKRAEQEAKNAQVQAAIRAGGSIDSLSEGVRSPIIDKLRADYAALAKDAAFAQMTLGPRHPSYLSVHAQIDALRRQITAELQRLSSRMHDDLKAARNAEQSAARQVVDRASGTDGRDAARLDLSEMTRKAATLRDQYEDALTARENLRKDVVGSPHAVVINQPIAQRGRVSPKAAPALAMALVAGLILFIVAASALEVSQRKPIAEGAPGAPPDPAGRRADRTAPKNPVVDEAQAIFVALPQFDPAMTRASAPQAWFECLVEVMERGPYRRAVSRVYDLLWWGRTTGCAAPLVVVASRERGAGATTVAAALALFACAQGERTLLLDCDSGNPALATLLRDFAVATRRFDLSSELSVLHEERDGPGSVMLGRVDRRERRWLREARFSSKFDLVILDCGALADEFARALDDKIDAAIMIRRTRDGDREAATLRRHENLKAAPAEAVA
jgi:polysaccharide biosynthesis transport protein